MLYAIQEGLLNPKAGVTADISDPIITGKNITLNAKSIGKELAPRNYSDFTNIKTLEKLAGVKGGDVTFNQNGNITIKEQSPITVNQSSADDKLNVTTQGNTFISGTNDTKFNVNTPIDAGDGKVVMMTGNGIDAGKGITAKDIELYAGADDLNARLTAGTNDVTQTVTEPVTTTTITYDSRSFSTSAQRLFDAYKDIPGFSVKRTSSGFFGSTYTLTAEYSPNDATALRAINQAMQTVRTSNIVDNYLRRDRQSTRTVEKTVAVPKDSVGTLTANAAGDINVTADANLPIKNITSDSNVNVNAKGNIISSDEDTRVTVPNVNFTATGDIATRANPLTINADSTTLRAKYAYIMGNYGNLNAAGTNVENMNRASGGEENSPIFSTPTTSPTVNRPASSYNNTTVNLNSKSANFTTDYGLLNTTSVANTVTPATTANTTQDNALYKVALALSQSSSLTNKSGAAYDAAARAWLNGMGYSKAEEQKIIDLALEISFKNLSSRDLINAAVADIIAKHSALNINAKSVA